MPHRDELVYLDGTAVPLGAAALVLAAAGLGRRLVARFLWSAARPPRPAEMARQKDTYTEEKGPRGGRIWVNDRTGKRTRKNPNRGDAATPETPAAPAGQEQPPAAAPPFKLGRRRAGDGYYHTIKVGGRVVGHIGGFEKRTSERNATGGLTTVHYFDVINTQLDKSYRGSGLYQQAVQQVADQFPDGLRSAKLQTGVALHKALAKMPTYRQTERDHVVLNSAQPLAPAAAGGGKVLYSGVVLDEASRSQLLTEMADHIPPGWRTLGHHMTTAFGKSLPPELQGKAGRLRATHWAADHELGVVAVRVESDIPSQNATPHITVAVAPHGKPVNSNKLTNWQPLPKPIALTGTAQDVRQKAPAQSTAATQPQPAG